MNWSQILVQEAEFNLSEQYELLRRKAGDPGAIVTFSGLVRELYEPGESEAGRIRTLTLEHYPGMTEKCLADIATQAAERWPLLAISIIHRVGELEPGAQIVFVGTASSHRHAAFNSAQFIMDYLKSNAPFWKKQRTDAGSDWVQSRESDSNAIKRWQQ